MLDHSQASFSSKQTLIECGLNFFRQSLIFCSPKMLIPSLSSWAIIGLVCPVLGSSVLCRAVPANPTVTVTNGTYVGYNDPVLNTDNFYSIAYAQPPVGELRFRQPQPLNSSWNGTRDATQRAKACIAYGTQALLLFISCPSADFLEAIHLP